jgi:tetratricopeptide (TPR) repeat protein
VDEIRSPLDQDPPQEYRQEFQSMLANAMLEQGRIEDAERELAEWKLIEGESFRAKAFEIGLRRMQGQPELALKLIDSLSPGPGDLPTLYLVRGAVYLDLRRYDEAVRDLQRAVAARPNDAKVHSKLSAAYRGLRRDEDAARHAQISSEIMSKRLRVTVLLKQRMRDRNSARIDEELADAYRELGDNESAERWRQRAARLSPPADPSG